MIKRKLNNDIKELLDKGKAIVKSNSESKFLYKVMLVNMVLAGSKISDVASCSGESQRTISEWISKADKYGFESLRAKKQSGRPPKLTEEMKKKIIAAIDKEPTDFGYQIWDGPSVSDYIKKTFGVEYSVRSCQLLFHKSNFSLIRPQTYPSLDEPNKAEREVFKKKSRV